MRMMTPTVILVINEKKRFAKGTLLAPIQFPVILQVASWMPRGTMKSTQPTVKIIVCAANSLTPSTPARNIRI